MTLTIRVATEADDESIARIVSSAYLAGGHLTESDDYLAVLLDTAGRRRHAQVLVAEWDGRPAGTVTVVTGGPFAEFDDPRDLEIRMLAVDPERSGLGVGAVLLDAVLDQARAADATGVALFTLDSMDRARRLYLARGFARRPDRDLRIDRGVVLRAYRLDLAAAGGPTEAGPPRPPQR